MHATIFPPGSLEKFGIPERLGEIMIIVLKGRMGVEFIDEFVVEAEKYSRLRSKRKPHMQN